MKKNDIADNMKSAVKDAVDDPEQSMKESGEDWVKYIKTHPVQSIAFGAVILLAIKGLFK